MQSAQRREISIENVILKDGLLVTGNDKLEVLKEWGRGTEVFRKFK